MNSRLCGGGLGLGLGLGLDNCYGEADSRSNIIYIEPLI